MTKAQDTHPQPNYIAVFGWLTLLTAVEVAFSYVQNIFPSLEAMGLAQGLLRAGLITVLVAIAVAKAALVGLFFMHLKYDSRWYSVVLIVSLFFAVLFSWALFKF